MQPMTSSNMLSKSKNFSIALSRTIEKLMTQAEKNLTSKPLILLLPMKNRAAGAVKSGKVVKVFKMPMDTYFKLFRVLVSTTRTDYLITNDLAQNSTDAAEKESSIRWKVEQLHREEKQLTGIENCQCRLQRSQRNHIAIASMVWLTFKKIAYQTQKTVYNLKKSLLDEYMVQQLNQSTISFA
ncbi:MAG: hypothetical protein RIS89_966 [Bacteroidota bacterium]|jgi:hypothetical protein